MERTNRRFGLVVPFEDQWSMIIEIRTLVVIQANEADLVMKKLSAAPTVSKREKIGPGQRENETNRDGEENLGEKIA